MSAPLVPKSAALEAPKELKVIVTKDGAGRPITTFEGSPRSWMQAFMPPSLRKVRSIRTRR